MKETISRVVIILIILSVSPIILNAEDDKTNIHDHHAEWFIGGVASIWHDNKEESTSLHLHPELGYFISDDWAVGVLLGYGLHKESEGRKVQEMRVAPFVRYYYLHREPFNLYLDGNVGFNTQRVGSEPWQNGFEVGIRPGACLDLTEGLCLCLRMGFLGYRDNFFSGEEPGISANGFGIHFTPEELMIGLELEF
ncbi:hypothetical protein QYZ87_07375 [Porphyromonadaceae bacterium W3.11]|nr:hypothetical protein [Porphyromonadaceae bacterium W3.11]